MQLGTLRSRAPRAHNSLRRQAQHICEGAQGNGFVPLPDAAAAGGRAAVADLRPCHDILPFRVRGVVHHAADEAAARAVVTSRLSA